MGKNLDNEMAEKVARSQEALRRAEDLDRVVNAIEWADNHDDFDPAFLESLYDRLEKGNSLTEGQRQGLENIIEKFGIDEEREGTIDPYDFCD